MGQQVDAFRNGIVLRLEEHSRRTFRNLIRSAGIKTCHGSGHLREPFTLPDREWKKRKGPPPSKLSAILHSFFLSIQSPWITISIKIDPRNWRRLLRSWKMVFWRLHLNILEKNLKKKKRYLPKSDWTDDPRPMTAEAQWKKSNRKDREENRSTVVSFFLQGV